MDNKIPIYSSCTLGSLGSEYLHPDSYYYYYYYYYYCCCCCYYWNKTFLFIFFTLTNTLDVIFSCDLLVCVFIFGLLLDIFLLIFPVLSL